MIIPVANSKKNLKSPNYNSHQTAIVKIEKSDASLSDGIIIIIVIIIIII